MSDSVEEIFGNAIADLISDYTRDPINDDFNDFQDQLGFEAAKAVVELDDFFEQAFVRTQSYEDEASARLWEELDISPADWQVLKALWLESNHAEWLHDQHVRNEAATKAYLARLVAQGDG